MKYYFHIREHPWYIKVYYNLENDDIDNMEKITKELRGKLFPIIKGRKVLSELFAVLRGESWIRAIDISNDFNAGLFWLRDETKAN